MPKKLHPAAAVVLGALAAALLIWAVTRLTARATGSTGETLIVKPAPNDPRFKPPPGLGSVGAQGAGQTGSR